MSSYWDEDTDSDFSFIKDCNLSPTEGSKSNLPNPIQAATSASISFTYVKNTVELGVNLYIRFFLRIILDTPDATLPITALSFCNPNLKIFVPGSLRYCPKVCPDLFPNIIAVRPDKAPIFIETVPNWNITLGRLNEYIRSEYNLPRYGILKSLLTSSNSLNWKSGFNMLDSPIANPLYLSSV